MLAVWLLNAIDVIIGVIMGTRCFGLLASTWRDEKQKLENIETVPFFFLILDIELNIPNLMKIYPDFDRMFRISDSRTVLH